MVDDLKKIIAKHSRELSLEKDGTCDTNEILISKFYHGKVRAGRKILFFVSYKGKPVCIIKMIREQNYNQQLENEYESERNAASEHEVIKVPRVLFKDMLNGLFLFAEELVQGKPVGKDRDQEFLLNVYDFQVEIPKGAEIQIADMLAILDRHDLAGYQEYDQVYALLKQEIENNNASVFYGRGHGDLTYLNLFQISNGDVYLIDWEYAGDRIVWGVDFVHYFIRCFGIDNAHASVQESLTLFKNKLQDFAAKNSITLDADYFTKAYLLDRLFDILQKDRSSLYTPVIAEFKKL